MSIKTTLGQIVTAFESGAIANVSAIIPPGRYHFRVAKLLDAAERDFKDFGKQRQKLFQKYGVPQTMLKDGKEVPTGNLTLVGASLENVEAFNEKLLELLETETTIPYEPIAWTKLGIDESEKTEIPCPHCNKPVKLPAAKGLTVNDVRALGPLLVEEEEETESPPPAAAAAKAAG
jgi:hypothetical protein